MAMNRIGHARSAMPVGAGGVRQRLGRERLASISPLRVRYEREAVSADTPPDPLRILRRGLVLFLVGLVLAPVAALVSTGLMFMLAYASTSWLLLSFLGYWRETGRAVVRPGTLFVLILFLCALTITAGIAAVADLARMMAA